MNTGAERVSLGERLGIFSDAVVAIAMTLLAVELPVPKGATTEEAVAALSESIPDYLAFLGSFGAIAALWTFHHRLFRYISKFSPRLVAVNFLWLLSIVLIPFATEALVANRSSWVGAATYPAVVGLSGLALIALTAVAQVDGLTRVDAEPAVLRRSQFVLGVPTAAFLVAVPLAFAEPGYATALWVATLGLTLIGIVWSIRPRRRAL